jgi:hypothetical protein
MMTFDADDTLYEHGPSNPETRGHACKPFIPEVSL